jgi:DNA-binding NarL/FixJ family response regulator
VRTEIADTVDVVGEAEDVPSAIEVIRTLEPDVVLLDVHLPGGGGLAVLKAVTSSHRHVRFLALSVSDAAADVIGIIRGGAQGYVTKAISATDLCEAIARVHAGDAYFSPNLAGFVLDAFRGHSPVPLDPELDQLTAREREVLSLIATGYTYEESRQAPAHLTTDRGDAYVRGAAQAAAVDQARAEPLGGLPQPDAMIAQRSSSRSWACTKRS